MRILITGSRAWNHLASINNVIERMTREAAQLGQDLTVVHGGAPGADNIAAVVVRSRRAGGWPVAQEPHPADWSAPCTDRCKPGHRRTRFNGADYCPAAGMYRNELMVNLGADACFAFIRDGSPGATGCANLAEAAGITTTRITWEERNDHLPGGRV